MTVKFGKKSLVIILAGVFFILFSVFAHAELNYSYDGKNNCNLIQIDTQKVYLEKNKSSVATFLVHNATGEPFYLEKAEAYDEVSGLMTNAYLWDKIINPSENKTVKVNIDALDSAPAGVFDAYLKIRGHFLNGQTCTYDDIGAKKFSVEIKDVPTTEEVMTEACDTFELNVPNTLELSQGTNTFKVTVNNTLDERINVKLSGAGLTLYSDSYSVPENTKMDFTVYLASDLNKTWLIYNVPSYCEFKAKKTLLLMAYPGNSDQVQDGNTAQASGNSTGSSTGSATGFPTLGNEVIVGIITLLIIIGAVLYWGR